MPGLGFCKQGMDRRRVRGGKGERRGDPVAQQFRYKKRSCLRTVFGRCKAIFFRKCVVFEPGQQTIRGRTDDVGLRVVNVHIDKTGGDDAPRQVLDREFGELLRQFRVGPHRLHHGRASGIRAHNQQAICFVQGRVSGLALRVKTDDGGAVCFHRERA